MSCVPIITKFSPTLRIPSAMAKNSVCGESFYSSLLQQCTNKYALEEVHAHMFKTGFNHNIILETKLLQMCTFLGVMDYGRQVFDRISETNVLLWNVIIRGYAINGPVDEAITLYKEMRERGFWPDKYTFPVVLKACASFSALREGKRVHGNIVKTGFEGDVFVGAGLLDMYAKCGCIENAFQVFNKMHDRDTVSWSAMIAGYVQNGYGKEALTIFCRMQSEAVAADSASVMSVLPACAQLGALQEGESIHAYVIKAGFEQHIPVGTALLNMYAKCENIDSACQLFETMAERNEISWNAMIDGYVKNGLANKALELFCHMQIVGLKLNTVTISSTLVACAGLGAFQQGKSIHAFVIRNEVMLDGSVGNSLVVMYARCGSIGIGRLLFDKMSGRDVISWNAMIGGYAQNGHAMEALILFKKLLVTDVKPNSITIVSMLPACADLENLQQGKGSHAYIVKSGFETNTTVMTSLVAMYAKCGEPETAQQLFDKISVRDLVSWNAMIGAYAQNGHGNQALGLFHQMQLEGAMPNAVTMTCVLPAYAHIGALQQGKMIHAYIIRNGFDSDVYVGTAIVDMYSKCGRINTARVLFDKMCQRNVVSWSAMIAGYGMNGHEKVALELFFQMLEAGTKPTHVTFVSVLSACSHAGLLEEGWKLFDSMTRDYSITPKEEHYACMVDLLGRAGHLDQAQNFIEKMPIKPSPGIWGTLLGACRIHHNIELAKCIADRLFDLKPTNAGYYVLLSNIYAAAGRWDDIVNVRQLMKDRDLKKTPGCSWIETNNRVHSFLVGDRSHPQSENIYSLLESMFKKMKEMGYVPNTDFVLHDVEEELKEDLLSCHSEKLAIAFGLLNTRPGTPICITKNLRVCIDCHTATKFITKIVGREIIMRDANRFHHVKDGLCSCSDYW
ncbi:pentatricopeptide repeat-containing protein At3g26782, mitochondrial [Cryptomeria japonica]|uniref:pentatricopeptide repeat-containing protein At3g26782, mitochondrial n=1 Tax=Cryptomeria japonica TaxID=3369 RepID=UPI0027DA91CC|nr:pentatricopeptide repeat-containing protein At3g26782, mitochondrial [Cryptomeria japonica]